MGDIRFVATATRRVAAPREAIFAFEFEPENFMRVNPRAVVSDVEREPDGRAKAFTVTVSLAKGLQIVGRAVVMAIDPLIIEMRQKRHLQVSTVSVSQAPDSEGRFAMTYTLEVVPKSNWLVRLRRDHYQAQTERELNTQIEAAVALIEADYLEAGSKAN